MAALTLNQFHKNIIIMFLIFRNKILKLLDLEISITINRNVIKINGKYMTKI